MLKACPTGLKSLTNYMNTFLGIVGIVAVLGVIGLYRNSKNRNTLRKSLDDVLGKSTGRKDNN